MRAIGIALVSLLILSGCAASEDSDATPDASSGVSSEPQNQLPLDAFPTDSLTPISSLDDAVRIAANTFDKFNTTGIVEVIESPEGAVVLIHNPDQIMSYTAGWYNTVDGSGELIFDANEFTSAWLFSIGQLWPRWPETMLGAETIWPGRPNIFGNQSGLSLVPRACK